MTDPLVQQIAEKYGREVRARANETITGVDVEAIISLGLRELQQAERQRAAKIVSCSATARLAAAAILGDGRAEGKE